MRIPLSSLYSSCSRSISSPSRSSVVTLLRHPLLPTLSHSDVHSNNVVDGNNNSNTTNTADVCMNALTSARPESVATAPSRMRTIGTGALSRKRNDKKSNIIRQSIDITPQVHRLCLISDVDRDQAHRDIEEECCRNAIVQPR